jgi:serine/threonine-protein kinase
MSSDPLEGRRLDDRWTVGVQLARGGMSTVHRGRDEQTGEAVAIKVLRLNLKPELRSAERFQREARIAESLDHPNIVAVRGHGVADGQRWYLVLELIEGVSLARAIHRDAPFGVRRALHVTAQIADALSHAHEQQVLHRDLKPGNVLLVHRRDEPDVVKVLDFGLAKSLAPSEADTLTRTGLVFGTPEYISPEQACGQPVDGRCDIYACGAILFEMLTGRPPFVGDGIFETLRKQVVDPPPSPSEARDDIVVPGMVDRIVAKCLEKQPSNRFGSAARLARAVRAVGRHLTRRSTSDADGVEAGSQVPTMGQNRAALLDGDDAARVEYDQLRRHRQETLRRAAACLDGAPSSAAIERILALLAEAEKQDIDLGAELAVAASAFEDAKAVALAEISQLRLRNIDAQMEATVLRERPAADVGREPAADLVAIGETLAALERRLHEAEMALLQRTRDFEASRDEIGGRIAAAQARIDGCFDDLATVVRAAAGPGPRGELRQLLDDLESFDRWIAGHEAIIGNGQ